VAGGHEGWSVGRGEFSSKNTTLYAFLLQKNYSWPETGSRGLIDPRGLKM